MRDFRMFVGGLLLCLVTLGVGVPASAAAGLTRSEVSAPRQQTSLGEGWRFRYGEPGEGVTNPVYDDRDWQVVSVPHTWNRLGEYSTKRSAATNNAQGVGWYRLRTTAPHFRSTERLYLDFGAVGNVAEVWVNGTRVGEHRGAFSRFRFEISQFVKPGRDLLVVVRADNSKPAPGSSTAEVLPLAGDFFIHGGLYRPVTLVVAPAAGIDLLDFGGPGIYATTAFDAPDHATVTVNTRWRNLGHAARRLQAVATVRDATGTSLASHRTAVRLDPMAHGSFALSVPVTNPRRWNGLEDPYVHSITVELLDGRRVVDRVTQPLGFREFHFDPDRGFFLNGKHLALFGASRHQDRAGKGWALSAEDHVEDMAIMAEMGLNTVRMAHYQHDDRWVDEADRRGMVAWAEVPYVSASAFDGTEGTPATFANAEQQTRELIRQDFNHPAIFMWSVGNEVDASAIFLNNGKAPRSLKLLQHINRIAKEEDASRQTVFADCCEPTPGNSSNRFTSMTLEKLAGTADLIGYNRYYGWYYGEPAELGASLDRFHAAHPTLPLSVSEFGAGGALTQHSDNPLGGPISAFGRPHPEEYQAWYHEHSYAELSRRPFVFASWIWNMFDFASDLREEGEAIDLNDKGLVTYDRKTRKDAFYFYQARLARTPVLHLTGKRYRERPYPVIDVKAYSNAAKATLRLNGAVVGEVTCAEGLCLWPSVPLRGGVNQAEVSAQFAGSQLTDTAEWIGPDASAGLHLDAGDLSGHQGPAGERFGSDHFFTGGDTKVLNPAVFKGATRPAQKAVEGAKDSQVHQNYREGAFGYALPVADGRWTVRVHTFEPDASSATVRTFSVTADGKLVLPAVAPASLAGGALRAAVVEFPVEARGGVLRLDFRPVAGGAIVSAIEVVR